MDTEKEKFDTPVQYLPGVGPKTGMKLAKLGVETIGDLIYYFPRKYLDYSDVTKIADITTVNNQETRYLSTSSRPLRGNNQIITNNQYSISNELLNDQSSKNLKASSWQLEANSFTIKARIVGIANKRTRRRGFTVTEAVVEDGTGTIKVVWFNQPYLSKMLGAGKEIILHGKVKYDFFQQDYIMESPDWADKPKIVPVYRETDGVSSYYIAKLISNIINKISKIDDFLPNHIVEANNLLGLDEAIGILHQPKSMEQLENARHRMAFDELFLISLRGKVAKQELKKDRALNINTKRQAVNKLIEDLPFRLTADQQKAWQDVATDMAKDVPMNRLLNGDVGSGKTVIAILAAYAVYCEGKSAAIMAPTEILASQHYKTFKSLLPKDIEVELVVSSNKKQREDINFDKPKILIGTHALLFLEKVPTLALVIIDEQHRFGVRQRQALRENQKSKIKDQNNREGALNEKRSLDSSALGNEQFNNSNNLTISPHFLSMTATPIPRSLQLALFAELDVSIIREKPANRKEIKTRVVDEIHRQKAYHFIRAHIEAGRQAFVVVPLIEEQTTENQRSKIENQNIGMDLFEIDRKTVAGEYEKLSKEVFPDLKIGMLHGKMKTIEKDDIMKQFASCELDILVSTSVVEVGVDVPNASIMMIEDAERFGLAQLHQFRGRVGRGEHQSFCFLFSNLASPNSLYRLRRMEETNDGFKLAEWDLKNRGGGDIFGSEQSGFMDIKFADLSNVDLVKKSFVSAQKIVLKDPSLLKYSKLKEKMKEFEQFKHFE